MAVADTAKIIEQVGRWSPDDVAYIRRVSFENSDGRSFDLALLLLIQPRPPLSKGWPDPNARFWEVEIVFHEARDLALTVCGPWDIQTPGFCLDDISARQWDGVNLLVSDYEGLTKDGISFGAKSAQVRSCRPATHGPNALDIWREYPGVYGGLHDGVG